MILSRRSFLQAGAATGGLMLSLTLPVANGAAEAADADGFAPNAFVRIGSDGQIVLTMPYVEMGHMGKRSAVVELFLGDMVQFVFATYMALARNRHVRHRFAFSLASALRSTASAAIRQSKSISAGLRSVGDGGCEAYTVIGLSS